MQYTIDKMTLKTQYMEASRILFSKSIDELNPYELNELIAHVVKNNVIVSYWENSLNLYSDQKIAIYFSIEFLIGRIVLDVLTNTNLMEITKNIFAEEGIDINCLEEVDDTALGNGGLGRLAACFIESAATMGYPLYGAGLYYKYGLFKQRFNEYGQQIEVPDDWTANGEPWFTPLYDEAVIVEYQDTKVKAVPYVLPIIGYNSSSTSFESNAFPLTLWKAEPIEGVTNDSAAKISDNLYPADGDDEGKKLRLRQEYFFVSAMLQKIFGTHLKKHGTLDNIEDYYVFQLNDTHPVCACLEFIRLLEVHGYSFDDAFEKAKKCFAYTNHTIMSEALEKWPIPIFKDMLPQLFKILEDLNLKLINELEANDKFWIYARNIGRDGWEYMGEYELFKHGIIHMSRIACFVSFSINGVADVHSEIIKVSTLHHWYWLYPEKFNNKTNGVTPRRWIKLANPDLANFLDKYVGKDWITNLSQLEKLEQYSHNYDVLSEYATVKSIAKSHLIDYIEKHEGISIDPDSIIDCQVKRIHEYKRQLMNALRILYIYDQLKQGKLPDFYKTTFIIGGKAAPGYKEAKLIISLIKDIQETINNDSDVNDKIKVVFLTNFNVSYAEKVYAGANFSEQISTAGKEASGTSNMKFMMNGSPTIGTLDGANIEIVEESGSKNNYIFGATVDRLELIRPTYKAHIFLKEIKDLEFVLDYLKGERNLKNSHWDLLNHFLYNDQYFVLYDLKSYIEATLKANNDYANEQKTGSFSHYTRKCLRNTANSGKFSSDRTIQDYCDDIWHLEKVDVHN